MPGAGPARRRHGAALHGTPLKATLLGFARVLTLAGYAALVVLLAVWQAWLSPPVIMPPALALLILLLPLAIALPGLVRGRSYTHAWVSLVSLFYFVVAVDGVAGAVEPSWLPAAAVTATIALFTGSVLYVRGCGLLRRRAEDEG